MRLSDLTGGGGFLAAEPYRFATSGEWVAPANGYLRAAVLSGGGGGGGNGATGTYQAGQGGSGGASALAFWRWRRVEQGQHLLITVGVGGAGGAGGTSGGNYNGGTAPSGFKSSITASWGTLSADPGGGGGGGSGGNGGVGVGGVAGVGGQGGTGGDYYLSGGDGAKGGIVTALGFLGGILSLENTQYYIPSSKGSGGSVNSGTQNPGVAGGAGFVIIEFCAAIY